MLLMDGADTLLGDRVGPGVTDIVVHIRAVDHTPHKILTVPVGREVGPRDLRAVGCGDLAQHGALLQSDLRGRAGSGARTRPAGLDHGDIHTPFGQHQRRRQADDPGADHYHLVTLPEVIRGAVAEHRTPERFGTPGDRRMIIHAG